MSDTKHDKKLREIFTPLNFSRAVQVHRQTARYVTVFSLPRESTLTVFSQLRKDEMMTVTKKARCGR
jgi:hypothetical protein